MKLSAEFPVVNADDVDLSVTSAAAQATPPNPAAPLCNLQLINCYYYYYYSFAGKERERVC